MSKRIAGIERNRVPFVAAVLVVGVAALVIAAVALNKVAGSGSDPGVLSVQTPTPSGSPSGTPLPEVAFADCSTVKFGPALGPLNPPADIHVYSSPPPLTIDQAKLYLVTMTTPRGVITICLQPSLAPFTVSNFVTLVRNHFFDGLTFPRVEPGFVIQGGSPTNTQSGGPGYEFADEPVRAKYVDGAIAMANSGPNTNGSQFFICIADDTAKLQPLYNLFGKVQSGLDVAKAIQKGDAMISVTVAEQQ
jgi:cyclophilin family peptidyl-prolyl cis-trans isomerase